MNEERPNEEHTHPETPPGFHPEVPEQRESYTFRKWWVGGWLSPLAVAGFTLFWCLVIYLLIGDRPEIWKYGVVPYVPGQSVISSEVSSGREPTKQVELPEQTP